MKKVLRLLSITVVLVLGLLVLTGCDNKEKNKGSTETNDKKVGLVLSTNGLGQVSYYVSDIKKVEFSEEEPVQKAKVTITSGTVVTIDAKANEGWKFVKWTKDDKEYSKDSKLDIKVKEDTELVAVFESK